MQRRVVVGLAVTAIAATAAIAGGAGAAPEAFTLTFDGTHVFDATLPAGVRHEGPFTASAPFCPRGTAADVDDVTVEPLTVLRTFTCDDGSGGITVLLPLIRAEHGGNGSWRIVRGTGRYETLRGLGTYASVLVSGSPEDFLSITFHSTWSGTVDFDVDPPSIGVSARATKLRRPAGRYNIRVGLTVPNEATGARLTYSVEVTAGSAPLADRVGSTTSPSTRMTLRIKPGRTTRRVKVSVAVTDPVGNESRRTRTVTLPR